MCINVSKALPCSAVLCFSGALFAQEIDFQKDNLVSPQNGIYVGTGITSANDKYGFSLDNFPQGGSDYAETNYRKTQRNYGGQVFIGYKVVAPVFVAVEFGYGLNKARVERLYSEDELPRGAALGCSARLSMKQGNELSLKLKLGKMLPISVGNYARYVTPYITLGASVRNLEASFDYLPPSQLAAQHVGVDDQRYANHHMKGKKLNFIWGLGASLALENNWAVGVEYNCRKAKSAHEQKTLVTPQNANNDLDRPGSPRHYALKGKSSYSFSLWLSRSFSFK